MTNKYGRILEAYEKSILTEGEELNEANYQTKFVNKELWKLIKKHWPKEAAILEKGYDEKVKRDLVDSVTGSISRYGLGK